jgi:colanic acid/amylovoran biosynthesis protein
VLVVNQHGDNRGDEAAMGTMLDGLAERLDDGAGPVRFTVVHQFADPASCVATGHDVTWIPMRRTSIITQLRSVAALLLAVVRFPWRWLADTETTAALDAYADADLVVSAPGGPYFGDLYAGHEPVHWIYAHLAGTFAVPSVLYAPSAGPFRRRWWNQWRRGVFRGFDAVVVREQTSADYVARLMGPEFAVEVTTDSALATDVASLDRSTWVGDRPVVVVSAIDWEFADAARHHRPARRRALADAVVAALVGLAQRTHDEGRPPLHVAFAPQLRGAHDDTAYLQRLADAVTAAAPPGVTTEVFDPSLDATAQRARFAAADLVFAGRYHPAVFAIGAGVPVACVAYQHKAAGIMAAAGVGEFVVAVDDADAERLVELVGRAWTQRSEIAGRLADAGPQLRAAANRTADIAAGLVRPRVP